MSFKNPDKLKQKKPMVKNAAPQSQKSQKKPQNKKPK
jgi:hypothetical protein